MKVCRVVLGITLFSFSLVVLARSSLRSGEQVAEAHPHAYHDHPSTEPLLETLDPSEFANDHAAFVVYRLAALIKRGNRPIELLRHSETAGIDRTKR
jgi:hypothetical protein